MGHRFHCSTARLLQGPQQGLYHERGILVNTKKKKEKSWPSVTSHLVHRSPPALPASTDGGGVGGELSRVVNLSVVLQGRDAGPVDVHDRVQGAVVPRRLWQGDVGLPGESQRRWKVTQPASGDASQRE